MKRKSRRARILYFTGGLLALLALGLHLADKNYVYKALYHNFAGIDDNAIFEENLVPPAVRPQPWPQAANYNRAKLPASLRDTLEQIQTIALLVLQNDSLRFEEYWDGFGPQSRTNSFSVAKSIVSTLVGIAIKDGHIKSIDQPVSDFLPEFSKGKKKHITLRHLLMMSSGLNWDESYSNPLSMTTEAYYGTDLRKLMGRLEAVEAPGKQFSYKSGDTALLGMVLKKATGKSLSDYASERLWQRIGAQEPAEWSVDHKGGDEKAYCCFFSNAPDFARLGQLYLHQGIWKGDTLLSAAYVKEAVTPHRLPDVTGQATDYYGLQWWAIPQEEMYYARGILGQYIMVSPKDSLVIVRLGKKRADKVNNHYAEVPAIMRAVRKMYPLSVAAEAHVMAGSDGP